MTLLLSFPSEAPYRIDQVTSNPEAMLAMAIVRLLLATKMGCWLGRRFGQPGSRNGISARPSRSALGSPMHARC